MIWKGKELKTYGEIMDYGVNQCDNPEEAKEFMKLYFAENPYAYQTIGYLAGYYSREEADRIYDWFETSHPIFGRHHPTLDEALAAGQKVAKEELSNGDKALNGSS